MEKEFNKGDKVYWAKYDMRQVKKTCPICFGKRVVVLILGDDTQVQTPCDYCGLGFEGARGYVEEYEYVSSSPEIEITSKRIEEFANGRKVEYGYDHYCLDNNNLFATKDEAEARVKELIIIKEKEDLERRQYGKDSNVKRYSWHVGYYQREKKRAEKTIEHADRKIIYFKGKVKEEKQAIK